MKNSHHAVLPFHLVGNAKHEDNYMKFIFSGVLKSYNN